MRGTNGYRDNEPLTYFGRWPIYVATLIAVAHVAGMFLMTPGMAASSGKFLGAFTPDAVLKEGKWWLPFTYTLAERFSIFSAVGVYFLYRGAVEVERFYGRWHVLKMLVGFILLPVLLVTVFWASGAAAPNASVAGTMYVGLAFFAAFATLYPNVEYSLGITPKTLAIFLIALACVSCAINRNLMGVALVLATSWFGHFYILRLKDHGEFRFSSLFRGWNSLKPRRKPRLVVLPNPVRREIPKAEMAEPADDAEVDALLDKIAKSGLASLSAAEKARLERAREELLKKERR